MFLDFTAIPARDAYGWMVSMITPRPIAWVSTISAEGKHNLAPFSFFQGVCSNPPTLLFTCANDRTGRKKDTLINIEQTGEFVVNIVSHSLREPMNLSSASLPHGESEFEKFSIASAPARHTRSLLVANSPVSLECKLDQIVRVGEGPLAGNVVFGRILCAHVSDDVLNEQQKIDPAKLDTIGRMGGNLYTRTTERFAIDRPD